ncbi:hypothetical protein [Streptomyces triculaminicus]|uniref:hypothetical protein n=1 Tax=Streptomyces triculaminicus TaxID=2816232 RepID=UPI0037B7D53A
MPEIRLTCISPASAAAVVEDASRPTRRGDMAHTVRQDGTHVVIGYYDLRWPMNVAEWAHENGHAHDDDAARVIVGVQ